MNIPNKAELLQQIAFNHSSDNFDYYQTKNNDLNYLIDPTLYKFSRLFVLLFENEDH